MAAAIGRHRHRRAVRLTAQARRHGVLDAAGDHQGAAPGDQVVDMDEARQPALLPPELAAAAVPIDIAPAPAAAGIRTGNPQPIASGHKPLHRLLGQAGVLVPEAAARVIAQQRHRPGIGGGPFIAAVTHPQIELLIPEDQIPGRAGPGLPAMGIALPGRIAQGALPPAGGFQLQRRAGSGPWRWQRQGPGAGQ
ncbi:MAG: hypothetical protein NT158_08160 [Cyanobacteria bacterium]|nr:hypothetical protein [Cyanobacteriota bacterium]